MIETDLEALDFSALLRPGDRVAWGQAAAEPVPLTRALMQQRHRIGGRFSVFMGATWSDTLDPTFADVVDFQAYCGSGANRLLADAGVLDVLSCHYSDLPVALGAGGANAVDVLLLQLANPGPDGRYSLSVAHEYLTPLIDSARVLVAEVNAQAPWTHGERSLRLEDIDVLVRTDRPLVELARAGGSSQESVIADRVAGLIDDGATLQAGVGAVPEAVLARLGDRRHLGLHTGALGDAAAGLIECGAATNERKALDRGVSVAGLMMGSSKVHQLAHRNPKIQFRSTAYTHALSTLAALRGLVAINSALEVDLSGQVNAEVAAGRYVGAVGGAMDFARGARAAGGMSIIALPSRSGRHARIVSLLDGPVSTPRSDAAFVVTEHGVADLRGTSIRQRLQRMLDVAHPEDRAALERAAFSNNRSSPQ
ncbi:Succinyl-CoA:coenzyme A transferase [Variovorax sp. PBS-H4]|uniref:acetyl-CoA hydrolase/transferase family protein n=1 Tax=Variovorax sp. PBS-H4 TaxID=434008 RepID=UPI001317BED7|nr:acetyl-CoA hydrolase/transferase C-terminal domain-containing protein [Variovorax sp. PBS-H4]VTU25457.1 Succinyl-CoA:coenzyme A transferase [Variovorax sp. PBS-H4]